MLRGEKCTKLPSLCDEMKIMFKYQQEKERKKSNNDRVGGRIRREIRVIML